MTYQIENLKKVQKQDISETYRIARIIAKKGMIGKRVIESQGVVVPAVSATGNIFQTVAQSDVGLEYMRVAIESVQDALIRKMVECGKASFFDDQIGAAAIIDAMRASNESVRFSKESIAAWFAEYMSPVIITALEGKGITGSNAEKMVGNYLASFQVLAGREPSMNNQVKAQLIRAMELLPEDHDTVTGNEIALRLSKVQEATVLLAAL